VGLTSTVEAGILTGCTPAITTVLAFLVLREKLASQTVLGIICTVSGIILLQEINLGSAQFSIHHVVGNMLVLCAAASESIFNIISRKHSAKKSSDSDVQIHPMVQTLLVSAIAFVLSIIPALLEQPLAVLQKIELKEWLALVWYGLFVTALAFVFFYEGIKRCNAYTTAAFTGMIPLTSMLLSLFLLKESISYAQWGGGGLIILSMLLIGRKQVSRKKKQSQIHLLTTDKI
jgi:drug/metabolite transporter (DMT)-like permease